MTGQGWREGRGTSRARMGMKRGGCILKHAFDEHDATRRVSRTIFSSSRVFVRLFWQGTRAREGRLSLSLMQGFACSRSTLTYMQGSDFNDKGHWVPPNHADGCEQPSDPRQAQLRPDPVCTPPRARRRQSSCYNHPTEPTDGTNDPLNPVSTAASRSRVRCCCIACRQRHGLANRVTSFHRL